MADEIRAEMVANVWKVVASVGDQVADGDTLVILESMKMEIPVVAESEGTVAQLAVNEGDVVQEGDLIAVIEGRGEHERRHDPSRHARRLPGGRGADRGRVPGRRPTGRRPPVSGGAGRRGRPGGRR